MILGYLVLAHLLGDFIFQPTKLVLWKFSSKWGILVHSIIHLLLLCVVFLPFLINGNYPFFAAIGFVAVCHFFIDQAKISYDLRHDNKIAPFVADQLLHLFTIGLAASFMIKAALPLPNTEFYQEYSDTRMIVFLSAIVCVSAVVEVFRYQRKRQKNSSAKYHPNYTKMLLRVLVFTLIYGSLMALVPYL